MEDCEKWSKARQQFEVRDTHTKTPEVFFSRLCEIHKLTWRRDGSTAIFSPTISG
jgi:hypothetical protein